MAKYKVPSIKDMIDAGVHFGHRTRRWHPNMEPYIYTVKNDIHIIDLELTQKKLEEACDFLYEIGKKGGDVVFVGTKKQAVDTVELEAKNSGAMYVTERWIGGTLTNIRTIRKNIEKLLELISRRESGDLEKYTKMERLLFDREIEKLKQMYGGITNLKRAPKAVFVIDPRREKTAVREAHRLNIPVVALMDTNSDPTEVDYPIPGNDDAIKSILLIVRTLANALKLGYEEHAKKQDEEEEQEVEVKVKTGGESVVKVEDEFVDIEEESKENVSNVEDGVELSQESESADENMSESSNGDKTDKSDADLLRQQLQELRKKREDIILERGKSAQENKDLRENASFDYWDQEERNVSAQINQLMKEIDKITKSAEENNTEDEKVITDSEKDNDRKKGKKNKVSKKEKKE